MQCYLDREYPSKKAIKEAVAAGKQVTVYGMNPFGATSVPDGTGHTLVGPGPYNRKYYAQITVVDGAITKIK